MKYIRCCWLFGSLTKMTLTTSSEIDKYRNKDSSNKGLVKTDGVDKATFKEV